MRRNSHGARAGGKFLFLNALALASTILTIQAPASGAGLSPYLPLHLDPVIEREVEQVLILADKPVLTRPIPASIVLDALPAACRVDKPLCDRVWRYLARLANRAALDVASLELAATSGADIALPNSRGLTNDSAWQAAVRAHFQPGAYLLFTAGGVGYEGRFIPTGSVMSVGFDAAQLDVGYRNRSLSPMTDSSMLIGTQAETMPSLTLANSRALTRAGLRYEFFLARMSESDSIAVDTGLASGHPSLAGMHLSTEPVRGWSLGVNRLLQYGGGGRPDSFGDLFNAFFQPSRFDNAGPGSSAEDEFGNQLFSITSRFIYPGATSFAVYFEYAGEDTSRGRNYLLGNSALSAGVHIPQLWERFDLTYEASEWQNAWYVNGLYGDGLTNEGHILGHWGGDWRAPGDAVGAQTHMVRLGWAPTWGGWMELRYRTLQNESYGATDYTRANELELQYSRSWRQFTVGAEVIAGRDVFGEDFSRAGAFIRYDKDSTGLGFTPGRTPPPASLEGAEIFVDAGASAARARVDLTDAIPRFNTETKIAPHLGLGARRAVSGSSDLGVRLEMSDVDSHLLLAVRALDYRYRFKGPLALTAFIGAARYDLATPAYGLYGGVGAQWRDILPKWDLGADLRAGFKVARDQLLPGEPQDARGDSFYDISGATLYLSRRF